MTALPGELESECRLCPALGDRPQPQVRPGRGSQGEALMRKDHNQLRTDAVCVTEATSLPSLRE